MYIQWIGHRVEARSYVSACQGANVAKTSPKTDWYELLLYSAIVSRASYAASCELLNHAYVFTAR